MSNLIQWSATTGIGLAVYLVLLVGVILLLRLSFNNKRKTKSSRTQAVSLETRYQLGSKHDFSFDKFEGATSIELYYLREISFQKIIKDAETVRAAIRFIQHNSNGWVQTISADVKTPFTTCSIEIRFYEDTGHLIDTYSIAGNRVLVYDHMSYGYWKLVDRVQLAALAKMLGIPDNLLHRFREEECFPLDIPIL